MLSNKSRLSSLRIAAAAARTPLELPLIRRNISFLRYQVGSPLPKSRYHNGNFSQRSPLPIAFCRSYANGRPHPPGGTHRMDMSGGEEKSALEQYGVDLTEKARQGKLDPVIGRDAESMCSNILLLITLLWPQGVCSIC